MTDSRSAVVGEVPETPRPLCWICNENEANSAEHKTKRSDLLAVLGRPPHDKSFFYNDLERRNLPVQGLNAKILKSPIRICTHCNSTRTQSHDRAWECMSDGLRARQLKVGQWVRANRIFAYDTHRNMTNVQLFFVKLFGCMICEANANGPALPIDIGAFSRSIMMGRAHPEVYLQFGKCDGIVGRSNLHCWTSDPGAVLTAWLYELDTIAVSVLFAQAGRWEHRADLWHPKSSISSRRFLIADFMYGRRAAKEPAQRMP